MRVWGRIPNAGTAGGFIWQKVETDENGNNDLCYVIALIQCLKLSIAESPFWADWGIPAKRSVVQQVFPDYYVTLMQQRYAQYFASLKITKVDSTTPTYNVEIITHQGVKPLVFQIVNYFVLDQSKIDSSDILF